MFEALGSRTYRWRYLIVVAWVLAVIASVKLAPSLAGAASSDQAAFLPATTPSMLANDALEKAFPGATATSTATLTFSRDTGLTDADRAYLDATATWVRSADAPPRLRDAVTGTASATSRPELESMLKSPDGQLQLLLIDLNVSSAGDAASAVVSDLRTHIAQTAPAGLVVHVTGTAGITSDYLQAVKAGTDSTTTITIILVLVILLLIYRAPLAAMVPLVTIGGAYIVSRGVLGLLAAAGWKVSSLLDTFLVVMVFGVGTDYAIFLISRFREEVSGGVDWHDASRDTVRRIGAVISASAATVIVGLGAMAFGEFEMIKSTGPAIAVSIAITLVAGLTLAPAMLGIFGHYLFWPMHTRPAPEGEPGGFFARLAAAVSRHPGVVTLALIVALGLPAMFVGQMHTNFDTLAELPASSDARQGFDVVASHLGKGKLVQSTGLIESPSGDMLAPANLARLRDTALQLQSSPGVAQVTSLVTPKGDGKVPDGFRPSIQLGTIGDAFSADSSSSSSSSAAASGSSSSLLDPKLTDGLDQALNYVGALGAAYPDVAGRAEYRAARQSITAAQDLVARVKKQTVVATQLRTLAAAITAPTAAASGSGSSAGDTSLMSKYLDELETAYPEVRSLQAYRDAVRSAASLAVKPTAGAAVDTANAMNALAIHFDSQPESRLSPNSLAGTASAKELKREAKATFEAIPGAFRSLASVFAARPDDLFVPVGLGGDDAQKLTDAVNAFVSKDHSATRFYLISADDPYATTSFETVRSAQASLAATAPSFGPGAQAYLGGPTAQFADVQSTLEKDFNRVGIITVIGIFLVLVILLRAIVAPLYLVGTVLLSYLSAVGLSAFLFQDVLHHAGISFYLPLMVFVLLVALGSDYNIFLMSRVREESEHRSIRDGIRIASGHTGSVITSAGLILAGTFGSMATAPLVVLFQVGVAVAIGVLIDTFVVRSILVPAITTLVGDRAWWPSGSRFTGPALAPAGASAAGAAGAGAAAGAGMGAAFGAGTGAARVAGTGPAATAELSPAAPLVATAGTELSAEEGLGFLPVFEAARPPRRGRSLARAAVALGLAILVPVTFAGLVTWAWQPQAGATTIQAALVNADTGTTVTAGDGSTKQLALGKDISDGLVAGDASGVAWTATTEQAAADGLASGEYAAVLTIPADFSRAIAAIRAGTSGSTPSATLHLATGSGGGNVTAAIARSVTDAITASATRNATASYVEDVLLGVSSAQSNVSTAASSAKDVANSATSLANSASSVNAVSGEMVSGLDKLASGTAKSLGGTTALVDATNQLATGMQQLASAASALAGGAAKTASGASALASGAASLADGLSQLDAQTKALPGQTSQLASGASDLAAGVSQTASGAAALSAGLQTLAANTTGFGSQVQALEAGAASLATGAEDLKTGASQAAAAVTGVKTGTSGLKTAVDGYTGGVDQLAANCVSLGGGATVCGQLAAIAAGSATVRGTAAAVASGAGQAATAADGVASGASSVADGASSLRAGISQLAAGAPAIESGIASSAAGASALSAGAAQLNSGASGLADGTKQLAAGMPQLADGVSSLASGASQTSSGAAKLATGAAALASGTGKLASGLDTTAAGASKLASGTKSAASGASQLTDAINQALDGARIVQAETGVLANNGTSLSSDASKVSDALTTTAGAMPASSNATDRSQVAARVADPITVQTTASDGNAAGIAPLAMVLALWLGALAALLAVPALGRGRRWWAGPVGAVGLAAVAGLVAAGLMVAGLDLGVGLAIARLPMLVGMSLLAAAAFAMVIGALAAAFGLRGWVAALLLAGLGVAASGYPFGVDALPGPLALVRPLLPTSWAVDAIRACIESASSSVVLATAVLAAWLIVGAMVVLAVTVGRSRRADDAVAARLAA